VARKQRFIAGIYNYCDRWCERCPHTDRCRVYRDTERAARRHRRRGRDPSDMGVALGDVGRSFEKVRRMLERQAKKEGWDLDELAKPSPEDEAAERDLRRHVRRHPLVREALSYTQAAGELLARLHDEFNETAEDAEKRSEFMDVDAEAGQLGEVRRAVEVIGWDHVLISAKVRRAVRSRREGRDETDADFAEAEGHDAAGSAFVARNCLRRSQAALMTVYEWDEKFRDEAIGLLASAEKIQRGLERQIPGCVTFVWPPEEEEADRQ